MADASLFAADTPQRRLREYLSIPAKGVDFTADEQWQAFLTIASSVYNETEFQKDLKWPQLPGPAKWQAAQKIVDQWHYQVPHVERRKIYEVALWRIRYLHRRRPDKRHQEARVSSTSASQESQQATDASNEEVGNHESAN